MKTDIKINGITYTPAQLIEAFLELKDSLESSIRENRELRKEIEELERELRVKEDLFDIRFGIDKELRKDLENADKQIEIVGHLIDALYLITKP